MRRIVSEDAGQNVSGVVPVLANPAGNAEPQLGHVAERKNAELGLGAPSLA